MEPKHKKRVACATCGKIYVCIASLQKHENMHTHQDVNKKVKIVKQTLLKCELCKYESTRKSCIDM